MGKFDFDDEPVLEKRRINFEAIQVCIKDCLNRLTPTVLNKPGSPLISISTCKTCPDFGLEAVFLCQTYRVHNRPAKFANIYD